LTITVNYIMALLRLLTIIAAAACIQTNRSLMLLPVVKKVTGHDYSSGSRDTRKWDAVLSLCSLKHLTWNRRRDALCGTTVLSQRSEWMRWQYNVIDSVHAWNLRGQHRLSGARQISRSPHLKFHALNFADSDTLKMCVLLGISDSHLRLTDKCSYVYVLHVFRPTLMCL